MEKLEAAFLVAVVDALRIGMGSLYWKMARDLTASVLAEGRGFWAWLWIVLSCLLAAGVTGAVLSAAVIDGPGPDAFFLASGGIALFYEWFFLALIIGGFGIASGRRWFNDPLNPRGRYGDARPKRRK